MTDWLTNLKPGDEVGVERRGFHGGPCIGTVQKITPTGRIVVKSGPLQWRFDSRFGIEIGTGHHKAQLVPPTQGFREKIEAARLISTLRAVRWETVELGLLRRVVELVGGEKL